MFTISTRLNILLTDRPFITNSAMDETIKSLQIVGAGCCNDGIDVFNALINAD